MRSVGLALSEGQSGCFPIKTKRFAKFVCACAGFLDSASNTIVTRAHTRVPLRCVDVEILFVMTIPQILTATALVVFNVLSPSAQTDAWTVQQLESADLARHLPGWSDVEKDVLLHINLVRMYPLKYLKVEVKPWDYPKPFVSLDKSSHYYQSLLRELRTRPSVDVLEPMEELKASASCFASAQGQTSQTGHDRSRTGCPELNTGENCGYGMRTGRDIVIDLLVDEGVSSLGHRENILNPSYRAIGVGHAPHRRYGKMTVQEFSR